jgi:hypothetical protein
MATKEMYLVFTRFYKGEDECPEVLKSHQSFICQNAWKMEALWVRQMIECGQIPSEYSYSYHNDGLADFSKDDGVPQSLKEFFYGYGLHRAEGMLTTDEFKEWYYQYLSLGNAYKKSRKLYNNEIINP